MLVIAAVGAAWAGTWHSEGSCIPDSVARAIGASSRVDVYKFNGHGIIDEDHPSVGSQCRIDRGFAVEPYFRLSGGGGYMAAAVVASIADSIAGTLRREFGNSSSYNCRASTLCGDIPHYGVRFIGIADTTTIIVSDACRSASLYDNRGNLLGGGEISGEKSEKWAQLLAAAGVQ